MTFGHFLEELQQGSELLYLTTQVTYILEKKQKQPPSCPSFHTRNNLHTQHTQSCLLPSPLFTSPA